MRLPNDVRPQSGACVPARYWALGLTAMLAACGRGGSDVGEFVTAGEIPPQLTQSGPAADYPVVLGAPYMLDGQLYTPVDRLNHDEVGFASSDNEGGSTISVAHKTLPLPSYVEVTALDSGKTILARVERRGPMTGDRVLALSQGAMAQLQIADGAPIRVRRVNPLETDRAKLRMGESAPLRIETPKSLLTALTRNLPAKGSATLHTPNNNPAMAVAELPAPRKQASAASAPVVTKPPVAAMPKSFDQAFSTERKVVTAYPLAPIKSAAPAARPKPVVISKAPKPDPKSAVASTTDASDGFVVQAAAFSSKANAERAANSIDGFVEQSGKFYRVRKGPFANRGQAEAALAKIRAAGYSDARVFTAG